MYNHFIFTDGTNPYITYSDQALIKMFSKYDVDMIGINSFIVNGPAAWYSVKPLTAREKMKAIIREIAQRWQDGFDRFNYSYFDFLNWQNFFEEYGRKYGLLREFKENGII